MLTDIFAHRYANVELRNDFEERDRRLLVQCFRLLSEEVFPYYVGGNESQRGKEVWTDIHSRLAMELGFQWLSPATYSYQSTFNGQPYTQAGTWPIIKVCENWMFKPFDGSISADQFIKERLSLIEIGFRRREMELAVENARLPAELRQAETSALFRSPRAGIVVPGNPSDGVKARNAAINMAFQRFANELNTRFRQAGYDLNYHNGFIQRSSDDLISAKIDGPFWKLVAEEKWKNVDLDMKEAFDHRDSGKRDAGFYALRALESTIKIISDEKGWSHGNEKGAHNYIDNLASKRAGFIAGWEATSLKGLFSELRNPFGHGPGSDPMPILTEQQADWLIENCMTWIKSLILRLSPLLR